MDDGKGIGTHAANWSPAREKLYSQKSQAFQDGSQHISDTASGSSLNESWSAAPSPALTASTLGIVLRSKA